MNEGYNVDVLVFDGCMVRKDENKEITDELLNRLSVYVCEKTGYKIEFAEKDLDKSIDLSIYEDAKNDIESTVSYYKDKEEFEKTHLKIMHPPIYISIIKGKFELQSRDGLIQSYQDKKTIIKEVLNGKEVIQKTSFIKTWINDENNRKYESLVFTPSPLLHYPSDYTTWLDLIMKKNHYLLISM